MDIDTYAHEDRYTDIQIHTHTHIYIYIYICASELRMICLTPQGIPPPPSTHTHSSRHGRVNPNYWRATMDKHGPRCASNCNEQPLVCLSKKLILDVSRGKPFHKKKGESPFSGYPTTGVRRCTSTGPGGYLIVMSMP